MCWGVSDEPEAEAVFCSLAMLVGGYFPSLVVEQLTSLGTPLIALANEILTTVVREYSRSQRHYRLICVVKVVEYVVRS